MRGENYRHGSWNVICQECGRKRHSYQTVKQWDGRIVCEEHAEDRHPQQLKRAIPDRQNVPFARPVPTATHIPSPGTSMGLLLALTYGVE